MRIITYKELITNCSLSRSDIDYIIEQIEAFQDRDIHFYDKKDVFKKVFTGQYECFIIDDDGYKGCCIACLKVATNGEKYVDIISCIGTFKGKFQLYIEALRAKIQEVYADDGPVFYKIDGRLGWSKYFKKSGMVEMSRTFVGAFKYA